MQHTLSAMVAALALACASTVLAQSNDDSGPATSLGRAVLAADNSTALQVNTGDGVQFTCLELVDVYVNRQDPPPGGTPEEALFNRCGEMVGTALILNGEGTNGRDLGLNNAQLAEAMQQLTGEEQVSTGRLATESSNGQFGNIGMRLDAIRAGARATAGGLNVAMNGAPVSGGNAGEEDSGWGWFLNGAIGSGDRDATQREDEYEYDSYGATLGFDYMYDSGFVAGVALGYSDYEVDFENTSSFVSGSGLTNTQAGGGFEVDGYSLSLYGIGDVGPISVDGLVSYGQNDFTTERIIRYSSAPGAATPLIVHRSMTGSTDSESLTVGLNASKVFDLGAANLAVSGGFSYLDVSIDGYTEKDRAIGMDNAEFSGLNLRYDDQDFESLQSAVGVQVSKVFSTSGGVILPYAKVEWRHEFENDSDSVKSVYASNINGVGAANTNLNIATDDPDEDYFEVGLGISAVFAQNIQGFIDYTTTVDLEDVSADLFTIGIRGSF